MILRQLISLTYGAEKYSPNGWISVPDGEARYMEAHIRHMLGHAQGITYDSATGFSHLSHAAWNLLAVMELQLRKEENESV